MYDTFDFSLSQVEQHRIEALHTYWYINWSHIMTWETLLERMASKLLTFYFDKVDIKC